MLVSKQRFDIAIERVRVTCELYSHLTDRLHFTQNNLKDILRGVIIFSVSALDRYIHDIVKVGIIEIYQGKRQITNAYLNFKIPLSHINNLSPIYPYEYYLSSYIDKINSYKSFQEPDKIKEALSLIWNEQHKWQKIADKMEITQYELTTILKNIVIRRNQIAHEADIDLKTEQLVYIDLEYTLKTIDFIEKLANAINDIIHNNST